VIASHTGESLDRGEVNDPACQALIGHSSLVQQKPQPQILLLRLSRHVPAPSVSADTISVTLPRTVSVVQADSHPLRAHPPFLPTSRVRAGCDSLMSMASTQIARAAAQLHEAAQDVARVAALRSAQPQEPTAQPPAPKQPGPEEDLYDRVLDADGNHLAKGLHPDMYRPRRD
jgi:hypothetical protein